MQKKLISMLCEKIYLINQIYIGGAELFGQSNGMGEYEGYSNLNQAHVVFSISVLHIICLHGSIKK